MSTNGCYSGFKEAANDITKEYVRNLGPLPHGKYDIIEMMVNWRNFSDVAVLFP